MEIRYHLFDSTGPYWYEKTNLSYFEYSMKIIYIMFWKIKESNEKTINKKIIREKIVMFARIF